MLANRFLVAFIVLIYNLVGTFTICSAYGSDPYYGDWVIFAFLICFPVTLLSFVYRFIEADSLTMVFIFQFIMLILSLWLADLLVRNKWKE